jgi:hypothetical protein
MEDTLSDRDKLSWWSKLQWSRNFRSMEELGRYERGLLPSRSQVQKAAYELHDVRQQNIPFEKKESKLGEMFQLSYKLFIHFILKSFKLHDIAQRETVELCITLNGAKLCNGLSHLTAGI